MHNHLFSNLWETRLNYFISEWMIKAILYIYIYIVQYRNDILVLNIELKKNLLKERLKERWSDA